MLLFTLALLSSPLYRDAKLASESASQSMRDDAQVYQKYFNEHQGAGCLASC